MMTFVGGTWYFHIIVIIIIIINNTISFKNSKIKANLLIFPLLLSPAKEIEACKCSLLSKHRQVLTNTKKIKKFNLQKIPTRKSRRKIVIQLCTFFDTSSSQKHRETSPQEMSVLSDKNLIENRDTPVWHSFLLPEIFTNTKRAHSRIHSCKQEFLTSFCDTSCMVHQNFITGQA